MYNLPIQGGYLGNAGGLNQLIAGGPDLPFGGGGRYRTIQEQYRPGQRSNDPVRIFPAAESGREGAIDIQFRRALMAPGAVGNMGGMMAMLPGGEQGPAQGPNTPVRYYPGMGYGPYGPAGGGLPPTPTPQAAGFDRKYVY